MKKVSFSPQLYSTHDIEMYDESRNGREWILLGLDRMRFNERIKNIDMRIGYIFCKPHRDKIKEYLYKKTSIT